MPIDPETHPTRRDFIDRVGLLSVAAVLPAGLALPAGTRAESRENTEPSFRAVPEGEYDLSWIAKLNGTNDRAVVDATSVGSNSLMLATRYLDNCDAAYGKGKHSARVVLNLRTRAIALTFSDATWSRFALGVEYAINEPGTSTPATKNPFLSLAPGQTAGEGALNDLVARKAIVLVCDFAMGHLASRLATKFNSTADDVHRVLVAGLAPGVYAVPSGIFGLARAQNAGCGFVSAG
jgi:hypothetical protein